MRVIFVRHGEKRANERDPELTIAGREMVSETGAWLAARGLAPGLFVLTPTRRTRQTLAELLVHLPAAPALERPELPETPEDWEVFTSRLARALAPGGTVLMVGHHPTQHLLLDAFGPPPVPVPRHHFATALVLELAPPRSWSFIDVWPGRDA